MKHHMVRSIIVAICMFVLVACTPGQATPTLALSAREKVEAGGYSLRVPQNFQMKIRNTQATINNEDSSILVSMSISPRKSADQTMESVLTSFTENFGKEVGDLKTEAPSSVKVGKLDGKAVKVAGTLFGVKSTGQVVAVDTGEPGFLIAFGFAANGPIGNRWETEGSRVFDTILASIEFFPPVQAAASGACVISSDATYGYFKENPIKVGGEAFDGPARERAYLDNLAGPKGEKISYTRAGSTSEGDTILDAFTITGLEKEVTLYIDEYSYTDPQAPAGFTCISAFPLTKP